jgi:CDP-glucose 4,6-dehydratase
VQEVLQGLSVKWPEVQWAVDLSDHHHEAGRLHLDCSMARSRLGWQPVWSFEQCLHATANWYRSYLSEGLVISHSQLDEYIQQACIRGAIWGQS